ncbi:hypothetical protein CLOBY_18640 [Clostridium saccharobutylicum]|nr:hypothetical protein CLOSC_17510 [Clostridium saccharobutylicum]OAV38450.1 hypothetical protein M945_4137 [Clostridium saccharobutylicum DSM 13864]AQR99949.1 hypothetical protein CSACC_17580 [Clostridium saccharobutylicum]AQS09733.1 hypothetical protein CLOBY_18640 [Clostridium saccharobutylicum]AQS13933.1 hypothetical protein CLOSACC_17580 [Clostridium saccharobutylicum]
MADKKSCPNCGSTKTSTVISGGSCLRVRCSVCKTEYPK